MDIKKIITELGDNKFKFIIGMLHMNGYSKQRIHDLAKFEIEALYSNGVDAVLAENYFGTARDVEWVLDYLSKNYPDKIYGVNILGSYQLAFKLAADYGAAFLQIDSVCGHLEPEADLKFAEDLARLCSDSQALLFGGVRFKYQPVQSGRSLCEDLMLGTERCDVIVVSGAGTGVSAKLDKIIEFKKILGDFPLVIGSGLTAENCLEQLKFADGAMVGSYFKQGGQDYEPIEPVRVSRLINIIKDNFNDSKNT